MQEQKADEIQAHGIGANCYWQSSRGAGLNTAQERGSFAHVHPHSVWQALIDGAFADNGVKRRRLVSKLALPWPIHLITGMSASPFPSTRMFTDTCLYRNYQLIDILGDGAYGTVYKAITGNAASKYGSLPLRGMR